MVVSLLPKTALYPTLLASVALMIGCQKEDFEPDATFYQTSAVFGENEQVPVLPDLTNLPNNLRDLTAAIGRTSNKCTAFHLGNGLVATAGHCFPGKKAGRKGAPCQTIRIEWGATAATDESTEFPTSQCLEVLEHRFEGDLDYALIMVDPVPGARLDMVDGSYDQRDREVTVLGYPNKRNLEWSKYCTTFAGPDSDFIGPRIHHKCDTEKGNSGSPILDAETGEVVAIHNGGDDHSNYATFITAIPTATAQERLAALRAQLDWDSEGRDFGPFENGENRLITALMRSQGRQVSFIVDFDIEDPYDKLLIADRKGRRFKLSGTGSKSFEGVETPVTIAFSSDYDGPSQRVTIDRVEFSVPESTQAITARSN